MRGSSQVAESRDDRRRFGQFDVLKTGDTPAFRIRIAKGVVSFSVALVDVALAERDTWPPDRLIDADLFIALWDASDPFLVVNRIGTGFGGPHVSLSGLVRVNHPDDALAPEQLLRWILNEAEAFEDGLRKVLRRRASVGAVRAIDLAGRRLARHRPPNTRVVTRHTGAAHPMPMDLFEQWARTMGSAS